MISEKPKCKGSITIGTGYLECEKCAEEALKLVPKYRDTASKYKDALREIEAKDSKIVAGAYELEISRGACALIARSALDWGK